MVEENKKQSSKFINAVDQKLQENIFRLDQKLRGLQAEVNARLELTRETNANSIHESALSQASEELSKAISTIKELVNMAISDDISEKDFVKLNQENIDMLRAFFANYLDSISTLKNEF